MEKIKTYRILLISLLVLLWGIAPVGIAGAQQVTVEQLIKNGIENGIQQTTLNELLSRARDRGMNEQQIVNMVQPATTLAEENLPAEHLIQKALEGLSKGVPDEQVISVVGQMNRSTHQAAQIVDPWMNSKNVQSMISARDGVEDRQQVRNRMVEASSKAITRGIPAGSIDQILSDVGNEMALSQTNPSDIITAIGILPDLEAGNQPDVARAFVVRALKGGFGSSELQRLPMAVNMAQQRSQIPAAGIMEGASKQMQSGMPASEVLRNLFNGNVGGGPPGSVPRGLDDNPARGQGQGQGRGNGNG